MSVISSELEHEMHCIIQTYVRQYYALGIFRYVSPSKLE
jgi:hypothetical protein